MTLYEQYRRQMRAEAMRLVTQLERSVPGYTNIPRHEREITALKLVQREDLRR